MKKLSCLFLILLTGCQQIPVTYKFPEAPEQLFVECGPLKTIDKDVVYLSEFTKTVVENYQLFHNCNNLVKNWQEWYNEQKANYDKATKK